jgi:hypothetical protein
MWWNERNDNDDDAGTSQRRAGERPGVPDPTGDAVTDDLLSA